MKETILNILKEAKQLPPPQDLRHAIAALRNM